MVYPIETILYTFVYFPIPLLELLSTHEYITDLNNYLNGCVLSVHSNLGNRTVGYLLLRAPTALFAIACTVPCVPPVKPITTVTIPDLSPTVAVIETLTRTHNKDLRVFNEYYIFYQACKKVLLSLNPESY